MPLAGKVWILTTRLPGNSHQGPVFFFLIIFIYFFFLAVLGLHCCMGFSLVVASGGYSLVAVHGLITAVAFLVVEHEL